MVDTVSVGKKVFESKEVLIEFIWLSGNIIKNKYPVKSDEFELNLICF